MVSIMDIPFVRMVRFKFLPHFPLNHLAHRVVSGLILFLSWFAKYTYLIDRFISITILTTIGVLLRLIYSCLIWLVLMALFSAAIWSDSISLLRFPFHSCVCVFSYVMLPVNRLKLLFSCFSFHFCFLVIFGSLVLPLHDFLFLLIQLRSPITRCLSCSSPCLIWRPQQLANSFCAFLSFRALILVGFFQLHLEAVFTSARFFVTANVSHGTVGFSFCFVGMYSAAISNGVLTKFSYSSFRLCISVFWRPSILFLSLNAYLSLISLSLSRDQA